MRAPKHSGRVILSVALFAVLFTVIQWANTPTPVDDIARRYEIPPSFNGIRILYGATLALLLPMSLFSAGLILENARYLMTATGAWGLPAKVHVINDTLMLACIFLGVAPDAVVLLAWGEQSAPSTSMLAAADRGLDMVSGLLFVAAVVRRIRSRPIVLFTLQQSQGWPVEIQPTWAMLWPKLRIGLVIIAISFGVAFAK